MIDNYLSKTGSQFVAIFGSIVIANALSSLREVGSAYSQIQKQYYSSFSLTDNTLSKTGSQFVELPTSRSEDSSLVIFGSNV